MSDVSYRYAAKPAGGGFFHEHLRPDEGLLAATTTITGQEEDGIHNPQGLISICHLDWAV